MSLLETEDLSKTFPGPVEAVRAVSFSIACGTTLGVIGDSGSGKSTLAKLVLGLLDPDKGYVRFEGKRLRDFGPADWKNFRKQVHAVFQHPVQSLNPKMKVRDALKEPYLIHGERDLRVLDEKTARLLETVELPRHFLDRRPGQLSGGECQRVAIARAICLEPKLVVCDEAVSSLDVLVRAGILNLLLKLQNEKKVSYLFISHDPAVVRHMSDRVLVMKNGEAHLEA